MALKSSADSVYWPLDFFLISDLLMVSMMVPCGAERCQVGWRKLFVTLGTLAGVLVNKMGTFEKCGYSSH